MRSLLGNTPKQRVKPNVCLSQCDKEHVGNTLLFFFSKCATTVFFLIVAYCCLTSGSLLFSRVQSTPRFTSCSYLSIFICLAVEEWGWGCVYIRAYIFTYIYVTLLLSFLFKIENQWIITSELLPVNITITWKYV